MPADLEAFFVEKDQETWEAFLQGHDKVARRLMGIGVKEGFDPKKVRDFLEKRVRI